MLYNTKNEPSKFITRYWVEINDESRETYNKDSYIKLKTSMIRSKLCDYDAYIIVSETIAIDGAGADDNAKRADEGSKRIVFKNYGPITGCISNINNTQIDNAKDIEVAMQIYNLIEYGDNYSKTSESLWQYHRDEPNDNITKSESFKSN